MKKNEKTYHERIRIKLKKIVTKDGKKRIKIEDIFVSDIKDLPTQYFSKKYCVFSETWLGYKNISFKKNDLSEEIFENKTVACEIEDDKTIDIFVVKKGDSFSENQMQKIILYLDFAGVTLNKIMKEIRKTEEAWTGEETITI